MSSSNSNRPRRSSRRAAAAAAGGGSAAASAAPSRAATARRRRSDDPFGKKMDFEEMESGKRYMAVEKKTVTKGMTQNVLSGEFDAVYEPDGGVRAPSSKPYIAMKAVRHEKGIAFLGRVYRVQGSELVPLNEHVGYLNHRHPEREIFLSTTHWDFYPMPLTKAELLEAAPVLAVLPNTLFSKVSEFINPLARR